jgi:lipid A ethanolaminephosphotransferase
MKGMLKTRRAPKAAGKVQPAMTFKSRLHQRVQALRASISCSPLAFALIFAVLNSLLYQGPLYSYALKDLEAFSLTGSMVLLSLFVLNTMLMALLLLLLALITPRLLKPMAMVIALGNAVALYFIQAYQVVLDKNMMGNVFNTDTAEAGSYFSFGLVLHVVLYGLLPVCVIAKVALRRQSRWRTLVALLLTPVLGGGLLYANAQSWLWIDAHGRKLGGMVLPWSYAVNAARFQIEKKMQTRELAPLPDATFTTQAGQKTIVVLVIGESARAANFSLYGYERETNPALRSRGAVALAKARSCATYTTAAVQCWRMWTPARR